MSKQTILLYGRTNAGKTALIGEYAEHVFLTTGKRTRLYNIDRGGPDTIQPYIDLGIIEFIDRGDDNPFLFLERATKGYVREAGKWVKHTPDDIGMYAFESIRSFAEELKKDMELQVRSGKSIGGGSNINFTVGTGTDAIKVTGGNMTMYGVAQDRVVENMWDSHKLPADTIIWTSTVSKDDDVVAGKVVGPDVIGKALAGEVPRWFNYTFRVDVQPAQMGQDEKHILYLGTHTDIGAGGASAQGNIRRPLDAAKLETTVIEPASLVKALQIVKEGSYSTAIEKIKKRLGNKLEALKNANKNQLEKR